MSAVVSPVVVERGLRAAFFSRYKATNPIYPKLCVQQKSDGPSERYAWLGTAPTLRKWVDERMPKGLLDHDYTIQNENWEATIEVDRNAVEDDQLGQIKGRVGDMGMRAKMHPDSLLTQLVELGDSTACYDGQSFFDTDHAEGDSGTLSNDLTYDATDHTAVTQAEFEGALDNIIEAFLGFKDDRGEPFIEAYQFDTSNLMLWVPRQLRNVARKTLQATTISNDENLNKGAAALAINHRLTSAAKIYAFYMGEAMKPFVFQQRQVEGQDIKAGFMGGTSEGGWTRRVYQFGIEARYNVGFGLWQHAIQLEFN